MKYIQKHLFLYKDALPKDAYIGDSYPSTFRLGIAHLNHGTVLSDLPYSNCKQVVSLVAVAVMNCFAPKKLDLNHNIPSI